MAPRYVESSDRTIFEVESSVQLVSANRDFAFSSGNEEKPIHLNPDSVSPNKQKAEDSTVVLSTTISHFLTV